MSLEQALQENTEALRALHAVFTSGASLTTTASGEPAVKGVDAYKPAPGDPEGTRYWVIEKHNTVYAERPGDQQPTMEGAVITTTADYLEKKVKYDALAKKAVKATGAKGTQNASPAPTPAASPAASPASSKPGAPSLPDVTAKFTQLIKATGKGADSGKTAARALIAEYKAGAKFTEILNTGNAAEILAKIEAALAADAKADDLDDDLI